MNRTPPQRVSAPWPRRAISDALFILRTVIAMLLALAVAFRLDLATPSSAAVTVAIISLPRAGMVLEKSFYRFLGTFLGAGAALLFVGLFAQHQYSFIGALALWIGVCTAGSEWFRGFQAYGWLLGGYTACLVGFPAFMDAPHAFEIAVDRVSIVSVGILSAGLVSAVLFPVRSTALLEQQLLQTVRDCIALLGAASSADAATLQRKHARFALDLGELESTRRSSVFENPLSGLRSPAVLSLIDQLTAMLGHLRLLRRQLDYLPEGSLEIRERTARALARCDEILQLWQADTANEQRTVRAIAGLQAVLRDKPPDRCEHWSAAIATQRLLTETVREAIAIVSTSADLENPPPRASAIRFARIRYPSDPGHALLSGARSSIVVILTCVFWILTEWPDGAAAALLAAVGSALYAAAPNPSRAAWEMCTGALIALPLLFICYAYVLPMADGFLMLALGLTPFIAFGAWLMTRPGRASQGSAYFIVFLTALNLGAVMRYDIVSTISVASSITAGLAFAMVGLAVIRPANLRWRAARSAKGLVGSLALLRRTAAPEASDFHHVVRGWAAGLISLSRDAASVSRAEHLLGLVLELGDVLMFLKQSEPALPAPLRNQLERYLDEVVDTAARPDQARVAALEPKLTALHQHLVALAQDPEMADSDVRRETRASAAEAIRLLRLSLRAEYAYAT